MVASTHRHGNSRMNTAAMRTLRQQAANMGKDARGLAESAGALAREQLDPVREYILEKPIQSLLIAGGVGMVLGIIFSRR
jgi:ElaB/YqjD/DUF883 family membrane-anchored ribosome-binding protein